MLGRRHDRGLRLAVWLGLGLGMGLVVPVGQAADANSVGTWTVRVVEAAGRVEVARAGDAPWEVVTAGRILQVGDRVRTGLDSRATLEFQDRSLFRLNQASVLDVRAPTVAEDRKSLFLRLGELFFLNRERPARIELRTPTTTSAIRGTEFLLAVEPGDGTTRLALLDGAVTVVAEGTGARAELSSGQQVVVPATGVPEVRPLLDARLRVQWCLHYPGVLHPADLGFDAGERERLKDALAAYGAGDWLGALRALPRDEPRSERERVFGAGLRLGVGQVAEVEGGEIADPAAAGVMAALRLLVSAVRGERPEPGVTGSAATATDRLAESYAWQARGELGKALGAAKAAAESAPEFGYAWIRVAELEWSHGRGRAAEAALAQGVELSPRNPMGWTLRGYIRLAAGDAVGAREAFESARAVDGAAADAWVGLGLVAAREGDREEARRCLQVASALEPRRAVLRSYLGKAWGQLGEDKLATDEFGMALELDPADPTGWLYRGLQRQQTHRFNASVRDLEESVARNDERSLFRSSLRLDQDRAIRQADLAISYAAVGLTDVAARAASRAVTDDYTDFAAHLFRARAYQGLEDPVGFERRWEAARESQLLVANLLAPADGANLSRLYSQSDRLTGFEGRRWGGTSVTEYRSNGDWDQGVSLYGTVGRLGYALDGRYSTAVGDRPDAAHQESEVALGVKQAVGERDEVYLRAGWLRREGEDLSRRWDPASGVRGYHFEESEEPFASVGYHRAWTPDQHTLALVSHVEDRLEIRDPGPDVLFLRRQSGVPTSLGIDPFYRLDLKSRFRLTTAELQHIWRSEAQTLIGGVRGQFGDVFTEQTLERELSGGLPAPSVRPEFKDLGGYLYDTWKLGRSLRLTAGVSFDEVTFPKNTLWAPVGGGEERRTQWSPKFGVEYSPWKGGHFRAAYAEGVAGQDFATSLRLEPAEVAGFTQVFRSLAPASAAGVLTGLRQRMSGVGFDQTFGSGTYAGVSLGRLETSGERELGVVENSGFAPIPDRAGRLTQEVAYREDSLEAYLGQLWGERWATGVRYSVARADLSTGFPTLPAEVVGVQELTTDVESVLGHLQLFAVFQHECGFYAGWTSDWYHQSATGSGGAVGDEEFWQHQVWVGYRFPHRRADLRVGVVNLTGQDYRLSPVNEFREPPRERGLEVRLRVNF